MSAFDLRHQKEKVGRTASREALRPRCASNSLPRVLALTHIPRAHRFPSCRRMSSSLWR